MNAVRALVLGWCAVEVLAPDRIVAAAERLAFENPGASPLRPWTVPIARLEGVAFGWLCLRGPTPPGAARALVGLLGAPALLSPRRYLDLGLAVAYEDPDAIAVRSWVVPATRALGLLSLLAALWPRRVDAPTGAAATADASDGP